FLWEVAEAVAGAVGADRTGVRLSPFGEFNGVSDPDPAALFSEAIRGLDRMALAYLHVINPEVSGDRTARTSAGAAADVPAFCRALFRGPLMVAGGYDHASAEQALQRGVADLVG